MTTIEPRVVHQAGDIDYYEMSRTDAGLSSGS